MSHRSKKATFAHSKYKFSGYFLSQLALFAAKADLGKRLGFIRRAEGSEKP